MVGVAKLLPADFDLARLEHSERRVCEAVLAGLDDSWFVVPTVTVAERGNDAEIDLVLASPTQGVVLVETKGGLISLREGVWHQYDRALKKSPVEQVTKAKHMLFRRMRSIGVDLHDLYMCHVVAMPDVGVVPAEGLGTDAPREILWGADDLTDPAAAIARVQREHPPVPMERFTRFLRALRPEIALEGAETAMMPVATRRIDAETAARLAALYPLDLTGRVLVTGGAGSGKTWLVVEWARRAAARGERTLVLTFNRPLADHLERALEGVGVTVHTYHDLIRQLLEPYGFTIPDDAMRAYWETVPTEALVAHSAEVGTPFDTVIIDEGQDMRPHWLASIEQLIDPAGPARLLMVADPAQAIYVDPWVAPPVVVTMPLEANLRSARTVAEVVRHLGGPPPLPGLVGQMPVRHYRAGGIKEVRKRVRAAIDELTGQHGVPLSQIAVLTLRVEVRDLLLDGTADSDSTRGPLPLARWEQRDEDAALCETVHRGKGLERAAVVLVDITDAPEPQLVYIGASRAMWSLTLVGTDHLAAVAGVPAQSGA
jgi:hypothetical protein